ncbi:dehydrogenase [Luteibacter sp.]|uniref:GHMP family kinase ATP-binding protein n=1 Tax=Luteibacter sp. TaxID=1886636 RepID=UPI0028075BA3|nr:dehydrogenase [Luteibacter sp.]MDQ8051139.1 dehydrogenase [Luteibacter sp.]
MIVRSRAPLRLGLAGGGTDVSPFSEQHGGYVMNVTIDKFAYTTIDESPSGKVEFHALDAQESLALDPEQVTLGAGATQLMRGVYLRVCDQLLGGRRPTIRIRAHSDAPPGSGLGSSSTMVVSLVTAFAEYFNLPFGEYEIAQLAYDIERKDLALSGGKQDQYAAAFGGFNFMEFYADDRVVVNPLRIKEWVWSELEASLVLYFTGVSRSSAKIIDEQSRNVREGRSESLSAMHRLKQEAVQMKEAVLRGDLNQLARVMQSGWEAKKLSASSITNSGIDELEKLAFANGAKAAKVSGAGGGGFMMFLCDPADRVKLVRSLAGAGGTVYDTHFTSNGASSWKIG